MKLWLIVAYLLFAQQEYNWNYGGRVVYVIEQTDQLQKFCKNLARKYKFKIKKSDLNKKVWFFNFLKKSWFFQSCSLVRCLKIIGESRDCLMMYRQSWGRWTLSRLRSSQQVEQLVIISVKALLRVWDCISLTPKMLLLSLFHRADQLNPLMPGLF